MIITEADGFLSTFTLFRVVNLALSIIVLIWSVFRLPLWLGNPPAHIRLLGLIMVLIPATVIGNAIDQYLRGVTPGAATAGTLIILVILIGLLIVTPENDGRPARSLRGLEWLGVRFRARRHSRR